MSEQPEFFLFAGTNGSGKSSFLSKQLPPNVTFFNPDKISYEIARKKGFNEKEAQEAVYKDGSIKIAAMKQIRTAVTKAFENKESCATETALSNNAYKRVIRNAHDNGYKVHLWYVGMESAEINIKRVSKRVNDGGHGVPKSDVVERYEGSLSNLKEYVDMADEARVYDNSTEINPPAPKLNLRIEKGQTVYAAPDMPQWVKDNVYSSPEHIAARQGARKEALSIAKRESGAEIISDAVTDKSYSGNIFAVTKDYVLQELSASFPKQAVLHRQGDMPIELSVGDKVTITKAQEGKSIVAKPKTWEEIRKEARELLIALNPEYASRPLTRPLENLTNKGNILGIIQNGDERVAVIDLSNLGRQFIMHSISDTSIKLEIGQTVTLRANAEGKSVTPEINKDRDSNEHHRGPKR